MAITAWHSPPIKYHLKIYPMLRIRIKTRPRVHAQSSIRLDRFFSLYLQNMFSELNTVLSNYHSIQEHTSRNRIIELISKKLKDLDLLQVFIGGACLLRSLLHLRLKGEDCCFYGHRISEMSDFLAMLHENMKTGFIPRANFSLALQTQLDCRKLLPLDVYRALDDSQGQNPFVQTAQHQITPADLSYIHRLMRIHLLRENIESFTIENGILTIDSRFFTFELALCGQVQSPQWLLFKVKSYTGTRKLEDQLKRRLTSIDQIVKFIRFFENRKNALEVFNLFESKSGFYQSFTTTVADVECKGYFKGNDFYFSAAGAGKAVELKNATAEDIGKLVLDSPAAQPPTADASETEAESAEFKPEIFGPNHAYFAHGMLFCLSKRENVCFIGKSLPVCGLTFQKLYLKRVNSQIEGFSKDTIGDLNDSLPSKVVDIASKAADELMASKAIDLESKADDNTLESKAHNSSLTSKAADEPHISLKDFISFVNCNIDFLIIAFLIKDLNLPYKISNALFSQSFSVDQLVDSLQPGDSSLVLHYIDHNKRSIPITLTDSRIKTVLIGDIASRIRLVTLQESPPAEMKLLESQPGAYLSLQFLGIHIKASIDSGATPLVETSIKELTEDIRQLSLATAFDYIKRFAVFYTHHLIPTVSTPGRICFDLTNFLDEVVEITAVEDGYAITGPKTLKISKAPQVFRMNDTKVFHVLYKIFLTDRFIFLKKSFEQPGGSTGSDEIQLDKQRRIYLTQEGIKFVGSDSKVDLRITNALNFERDILGYFSTD